MASDEPLLEPPETPVELLLELPVLVLLPLLVLRLLLLDGVLVAVELGVEVAVEVGVDVDVLVLLLVLDFVVAASAADVLLSCHTTIPVAAATATPSADTPAVTARALRRPRSRMFITPPLDPERAGH